MKALVLIWLSHHGASAGRASSRSARSRSVKPRFGAMSGRVPVGRRRPLTLVNIVLGLTDESKWDSALRGLSSSTSPIMATTRASSPRRRAPARNRSRSSAPRLWKDPGCTATAQSLVSVPSHLGCRPCFCQSSPPGTRGDRCRPYPLRTGSCSEPGSRSPMCTGTRPDAEEITLTRLTRPVVRCRRRGYTPSADCSTAASPSHSAPVSQLLATPGSGPRFKRHDR